MGSLPERPLGETSKQIRINGHWDIPQKSNSQRDRTWDAMPSVLPQQLSNEKQAAGLKEKEEIRPQETDKRLPGTRGGGQALLRGGFPQDPSS